MVPSSLISLTARHLRAARALLGWTQIDLSKKSNVALGTIKRMESSDGPVGTRFETVRRLVVALEKAGVEFLNDNEPGVRLTRKTGIRNINV
jgi:predicted transcriptional regulator